MPDAAPSLQPASPAGQSPVGPLTPERIERVLADFRDWLSDPPAAAPVAPPEEPVDLHALVGQFTALRHEVNLQTKAARAALEQNATALQQLEEAVAELREPTEIEEPPEQPKSNEELKPLLKAVIDAYDALSQASRQIDKQKTAIYAGLASVREEMRIELPPLVVADVQEKPGFWKRFFSAEPEPPQSPSPETSPLTEWHRSTTRKLKEREQKAREACDYLKDALDGLLTGYAMSMNRVDRVLTKFGLEPIQVNGERFDPEMMEVVEAVPNSGRQLGEVVEEVRRGYRWNGSVFRYAQVRVAR